MATVQFGNIQILDVTMKNNGLTDIPAGSGVLFDTANPQSGDTPPGCVLPTASGGVAGTAGITVEIIKAGGTGRVRFNGTYPGVADGSITAGGYVQVSDTTAKLGRVKAKGGAVEQLGQALNTASDGQPVLVFVSKAATA